MFLAGSWGSLFSRHFVMRCYWWTFLLSAPAVSAGLQICVRGKPPGFFFFFHYCSPNVQGITVHVTQQTLVYKARLCSATLLLLYASWLAGKENIGLGRVVRWSCEVGQNLMTFARLPQITATSSKETTTSSWKTAAWRSSSWVKSQRTGSAAERRRLTTDSFLKWQLASQGHCFRIAHYLRLPQCTASCKFLPWQPCTFLWKMRRAFQPV